MVSLSLFLSNLIKRMIYFGVFFFLFFFFLLTWGSFTFLDLWVYSFHQIYKLFGHISSNFFFSSILFGNSNYPCFGLLDVCPIGTLWVFLLFFFPSLFVWTITNRYIFVFTDVFLPCLICCIFQLYKFKLGFLYLHEPCLTMDSVSSTFLNMWNIH